MTMLNSRGSERNALIGVITPGSKAAGTVNTGYFPLKNVARLMAILQVGTLGASATVDAKLTVYTDASGTNPQDIPGAAITQLTAAGTDSNKQAIIDLDTSRVPKDRPYSHARLVVTVGTAASDVSALVLGLDTRYATAAQFNLTSVDEIVGM